MTEQPEQPEQDQSDDPAAEQAAQEMARQLVEDVRRLEESN